MRSNCFIQVYCLHHDCCHFHNLLLMQVQEVALERISCHSSSDYRSRVVFHLSFSGDVSDGRRSWWRSWGCIFGRTIRVNLILFHSICLKWSRRYLKTRGWCLLFPLGWWLFLMIWSEVWRSSLMTTTITVVQLVKPLTGIVILDQLTDLLSILAHD